jgi:hypothetical protein
MNRILIITIIFICFFQLGNSYLSANSGELVVKGNWGNEVNQLGIRFPSKNVMPIAAGMCIGGFEVEDSGKVWFTDSVNHKIKSFFNKKWHYYMVNSEYLGEVDLYKNKLYIISQNPDGYIIFDTRKEKIEKLVKVPFKTPGKIKCLASNLVLIEDISSGGIWVIENEKAYRHPAVALEAAGQNRKIYGLQMNFDSEARTIIAASLEKQLQEPEVVANISPRENSRFIFSKMAGLIKNDPVVICIDANSPDSITFSRLNQQTGSFSQLSLPVLDGPHLISSWKLCSDGQIYGFKGTASEGFKLFRAEQLP